MYKTFRQSSFEERIKQTYLVLFSVPGWVNKQLMAKNPSNVHFVPGNVINGDSGELLRFL